MKKIVSLFAASVLAVVSSSAVNLTFQAQQGTGIADLTGNALSGTVVQVGTFDGSSFSILGSGTTGTPLPGLFGTTSLFESTSLAAEQPAIRVFSSDGGSAVIYNTNWTFTGGDGTGLDTNTQTLDILDVVSGGALQSGGVLFAEAGSTVNIGGSGLTNPTFSTPAIEIGLVPEPSSYAILAGFFALMFVMAKRRKA